MFVFVSPKGMPPESLRLRHNAWPFSPPPGPPAHHRVVSGLWGGGTSLKATPGTSKLMKSPWVATVKSPWILRLATDSQPVATELLSTSVHKDHETCSVCSSWNAFGIRENPSWASLKASASACGEPGPLARTLRFYQDSSGMLWRCFDKSFRHKPQILLDLFPNQFNLLMTGSVQAHKPKSHPN